MEESLGFDFLRELSQAPGPAGWEEDLVPIIQRYMAPLVERFHCDRLGNAVATKLGSGEAPRPLVMLAAHMDEIGLVTTTVEEGGFARVAKVGGINPQTLLGKEVRVLCDPPLPGVLGTKPPHLLTEDDRKKTVRLEDLFVDIGLPEEAVRRRVLPGTPVVPAQPALELLNRRVGGKALDDRGGVAVLYEAARALQTLKHEVDVCFVATVQEELGMRGATTSAFALGPDLAIAIDGGFGDSPGVPEHRSIKLGKGPAIARGANIHPRLYRHLTDLARELNIDFQEEVLAGTSGTDAWAIQVTRSGVPTALLSFPLRYMHSTVEVLDYDDVISAGRLLANLVARVDARLLEGLSYDQDSV